ncbi:MAG: hypothetical protein LBH59_03200 [Planctomycetaceae bacterium]|nr:hypothetical protein [Planctomycetaceae bacterium]
MPFCEHNVLCYEMKYVLYEAYRPYRLRYNTCASKILSYLKMNCVVFYVGRTAVHPSKKRIFRSFWFIVCYSFLYVPKNLFPLK